MNLDRVVVLDFETTGLSPDWARVIEVGAVSVESGMITDRYSQLMDPGDFLPVIITQLTGITDDMLMGQPRPEDVMPALYEFIGDSPIVAHNSGFDMKFLKAELQRVDLPAPQSVFCTLKLARRLYSEFRNHKLGYLAEALNLPLNSAHRALDDAVATAHLWIRLCEKAKERKWANGFDTLNRLQNTPPRHLGKIQLIES